jgi:hypothetical protein
LPILRVQPAERDVVRYWNGPPIPARMELNALLVACRAPGGRVNKSCVDRCWELDAYLRKSVAAAPDAFVKTRQVWRQTRNPIVLPVYRTVGDPFVVFTIYRDLEGEPVVLAVHFGRRQDSSEPQAFDQMLWDRIIEPRLRLLAAGEGGRWVEPGKPA